MTFPQKRIALFASHSAGREVAKFFSDSSAGEVVALYLPDADPTISGSLSLPENRIFVGKSIFSEPSHVEWFSDQGIDAIVCVYWPWLLSPELFRLASVTVNFHPALLPVNRGWYPYVHSIIDGSPCGVTLHCIEECADTGRIWAQKEVLLRPEDTAKDIYLRLQAEIVSLFKDKWVDIIEGRIQPFAQDHSKATYHLKSEINALDRIDLDTLSTPRDLLNRLRARTFGDKGFAYYEENGHKIFIRIELNRVS